MISLFARLMFGAALLSVSGGVGMVHGAAEPLKLQFSLRLPDWVTPTGAILPDAPAVLQWSPDDRTLAIFGFFSGKLFLFDVSKKQLIDRDIRVTGTRPWITWSADSSTLALSNADTLLVRAADGRQVGRRDKTGYQCGSGSRQPAAFTSDGRFLWIACGASGKQGSFLVATKFTVPDLKVADTIEFDDAIPGERYFTSSGRMVLDRDRVLLSTTWAPCTDTTSSTKGLLNCRLYASCLDLQTNQHCFPDIALHASRPGQTGLPDLQLFPSISRIVSLSLAPSPVTTQDYAFDIYDLAGKLIRRFGIRTELGDVPPREFVMTQDGLVIASAGDWVKQSLLLLWDANTGERLQGVEIPSASGMVLSRDGRLLAALKGPEIRVYSTSRIK